MKRITSKLYERHAIAFLLLCYLATLVDSRNTSGTVGYILANYSYWFVWILAAWALLGAIYLFMRRAYPVAMAIASFPILAYAVMGAVFVLNVPNAPIAAFFTHFGIYMVVLFLINMRIRAMAKGNHGDDSIHTRPNELSEK